MSTRSLHVCLAVINAMVLAGTFYAWRFSYFWIDDFNNLFWIQRLDQPLRQMLWEIVNPFANAFRPFGMLLYWILWHLFDLNPLPYHLVAWAIHALNVVLLSVLVWKMTSSSYAAGVAALQFGFRGNFAEIYFSFGTIFEVLALCLMLVALLVYSSDLRFLWKAIGVTLAYLLAVKSKEMAITLPAVLLLYEICFRKHKVDAGVKIFFVMLGLFSVAFSYFKLLNMGSTARSDPYYMDFSVLTFGRGYGWYFDHLYGMHQRWGAWMIAIFFLTAFLVYRREKRGLFFLAYLFVTLLPVVFLVNHRFEFYWYVPFFGVAGLVAVFTGAAWRWLSVHLSRRVVVPVSLATFAVLALAHDRRESRASAELIQNQKAIAAEYERFVNALQRIPPPGPEATIYFRSIPMHFDSEVLTSATQVGLHRTDVLSKVVDTFPEPCQSCVEIVR